MFMEECRLSSDVKPRVIYEISKWEKIIVFHDVDLRRRIYFFPAFSGLLLVLV